MSTALTTAKWEIQHQSRADWIELYWESRKRAARDVVLDGLSLLPPWTSLMELGAHVGPMLARVRERFPHASLGGIDPNPVAVENAKVPGISLGDLTDWLPKMATDSVDVLLTYYTLAYIHPDDIERVLLEMMRVAKVGVVVAEPTGPTKLVFDYPEWQHPYPYMLQRWASKVMISDLPFEGDHLNMVTVAVK